MQPASHSEIFHLILLQPQATFFGGFQTAASLLKESGHQVPASLGNSSRLTASDAITGASGMSSTNTKEKNEPDDALFDCFESSPGPHSGCNEEEENVVEDWDSRQFLQNLEQVRKDTPPDVNDDDNSSPEKSGKKKDVKKPFFNNNETKKLIPVKQKKPQSQGFQTAKQILKTGDGKLDLKRRKLNKDHNISSSDSDDTDSNEDKDNDNDSDSDSDGDYFGKNYTVDDEPNYDFDENNEIIASLSKNLLGRLKKFKTLNEETVRNDGKIVVSELELDLITKHNETIIRDVFGSDVSDCETTQAEEKEVISETDDSMDDSKDHLDEKGSNGRKSEMEMAKLLPKVKESFKKSR